MHKYRMETENCKRLLEKANAEIEFLKTQRQKYEDDTRRLRNELNKIASDRERHQADAEKAGNEMNLMHSEIRKWQEKHTMAVQDL